MRLNFWDLGGQEELQSLWDKVSEGQGARVGGKIDMGSVRLNFWDLGGQEELQSLWYKVSEGWVDRVGGYGDKWGGDREGGKRGERVQCETTLLGSWRSGRVTVLMGQGK